MTRRHVHPENATLERAVKLAVIPFCLFIILMVWVIDTYGTHHQRRAEYECKREVRKLKPLQVERLLNQQFFSYRSAYEWCEKTPRSISEPAIKMAAATPLSFGPAHKKVH